MTWCNLIPDETWFHCPDHTIYDDAASQLTYAEVINKHRNFDLTDGQLREAADSVSDYAGLLLLNRRAE